MYFTTAIPTGCAFAMTDPYMQVTRYMKTFDNAKQSGCNSPPPHGGAQRKAPAW